LNSEYASATPDNANAKSNRTLLEILDAVWDDSAATCNECVFALKVLSVLYLTEHRFLDKLTHDPRSIRLRLRNALDSTPESWLDNNKWISKPDLYDI
jgi:hypothetical protein